MKYDPRQGHDVVKRRQFDAKMDRVSDQFVRMANTLRKEISVLRNRILILEGKSSEDE